MRLFRVVLMACGLFLSLPSLAEHVLSIYISNHAAHLTFGEEGGNSFETLSGSTLTPKLAVDIASWGANDSPSIMFAITLDSLSDTDEFERIRRILNSLAPSNVSVKIFASGFNSNHVLTDGNKDSISNSLKSEHVFSKAFSEINYIKSLKKQLEAKATLKRSDVHKTLFCGLLQSYFSFQFDINKVTAKNDEVFMTGAIDQIIGHRNGIYGSELTPGTAGSDAQVSEGQKKPNICGALWATTYAVVMYRSKQSDSLVVANESLEKQDSVLPECYRQFALGGLLAFGHAVYSAQVKSEKGIPFLYKQFFDEFIKRESSSSEIGHWKKEYFKKDGNSIIERLNGGRGWVNYGEFIGAAEKVNALSIGGASDKKVSDAILYVVQLESNKDSVNSIADLKEKELKNIKEAAVGKYLSAQYLAKSIPQGVTSCGLLLGEYSSLLFNDQLNLFEYTSNSEFMTNVVASINAHNQQLQATSASKSSEQQDEQEQQEELKVTVEELAKYFAQHHFIFYSQKFLSTLIHQYGSLPDA